MRKLWLFLLLGVFACDDSVTVLNESPCPDQSFTQEASICDGETYVLPDDTEVGVSGTYVTTITEGICEVTITTELEVLDTYLETIVESFCGEYILPDGRSVTEGGTYEIVLTASNGCDSTIISELTVEDISITETVEICPCEEYELPNGEIVSDEGLYEGTATQNGCTITFAITITHVETQMSFTEETICEGESFTLPNGNVVMRPGYYVVETVDFNENCYSEIDYIKLNVGQEKSKSFSASFPAGTTFQFPDGTSTSETGEFFFTDETPEGCDSTTTYGISIGSSAEYNLTDYIEICEGDFHILPDGTEVNISGIYVVELLASDGRDSIITTELTVHPIFNFTQEVEIDDCDYFTLPDGRLVNESGDYQSIFQSQFGCDSIVNSVLTFL